MVCVGRKKIIFSHLVTNELEKNSSKLDKMTFYLVILAIFKFSVISHCAGHMAIEFALLGTFKIIPKGKNFGRIKFNFNIAVY